MAQSHIPGIPLLIIPLLIILLLVIPQPIASLLIYKSG
jgi:hypothetical protein